MTFAPTFGFTYQAPFDDPRVREAVALAIPKEILVPAALGSGGAPAYTFLAAGFPGSFEQTPEAKTLQSYNPERAKQLLADAGYPDGKGFPELVLRCTPIGGQGPIIMTQGIAAELGKVLGIKAEVTGKGMEPDRAGVRGSHWPDDYGLGEFWFTTYIKKM